MFITRFILALAWLLPLTNLCADSPSLLPLPAEVTWNEGRMGIGSNTVISVEKGTHSEAKLLRTAIQKQTGLLLKPGKSSTGSIALQIQSDASDNPEGYQLKVTSKGVRIIAPTPTGLFYGCQTFLQLLEKSSDGWSVRHAEIADAPRFGWRGMMLDEARHFMGKEYVLHLLDTMALNKMNSLHWHLTDDQGWRIEIKAYPKLTSVGAWRGEGTKMPAPDWDTDGRPGHPGGGRYGGFYTQEDIREIVAYAKQRHIQIIPEIDMPGHASAITKAYPETLPVTDGDSGKSVHGLRGDVISVVREENYKMIETIFKEVTGLFPAPYIHVGGDEVNVNAWNVSPEHRKFMKKHGMKNAHQLQNHFMLRLEKILSDMDRTLVGWNEIMHGGHLSKDTVIMSWTGIGPGLDAARKGHPVVMCPGQHCYFDMKYPGQNEIGHTWAGVVSTQRAYEWDPSNGNQLNEKEQARIKGIQGCLWSEYVPTTNDVDYKIWPRACATAEVGWTPQARRNWADFSKRLEDHLSRLDQLDVNYRMVPPSATFDKGLVTIAPVSSSYRVIYTTDGTDPAANSSVYSKPFPMDNPSELKYRTIRENGRMSKIGSGADRLPVAAWKPEIVSTSLNPVRFELKDGIDSAGTWFVDFRFTHGAHMLKIADVKLLQNGKEISRDTHDGKAGGTHSNNVYRLAVPQHNSSDSYTILAKIQTDGGNDSNGLLTLNKSPYLEPKATVSTTLPAHKDNLVANAVDWNRSSVFWSNRGAKKGETFTITFDEPVSCKQISIQTGKLNSNSDIILDGRMELSTDGENFGESTNLIMGAGTIKKPSGMKVKALRLTVDADQASWIIVRDPKIR